jgi:hypothetical protein
MKMQSAGRRATAVVKKLSQRKMASPAKAKPQGD